MCKKFYPFSCQQCDSKKMYYKKFVKSMTPIILREDGTLEYLVPEHDEDDYVPVDVGLCCENGHMATMYYGYDFTTDKDIVHYLNLTPEERQKERDAYEEHQFDNYEADDECEGDSYYHEEEPEETADNNETTDETDQDEAA